jgi:pyrimidine-nucleoside phosphorylase
MRAEEVIHNKKVGEALSRDEIRWLVQEYTAGRLPDYQMAAFLMAVWFRGMTDEETVEMTLAMMESGRILDLTGIDAPKIDKHSTGGVGDKVSLVLAPLAAAAGIAVPMVSGRALGHTGGTLDKLESIPGFRTSLTVEEFIRTVEDVGCCIMGQTDDLAPADRKLYALRDVTSTVDCLPLIASSIMSKKLAEGCDGLVMDVKLGRGSFTPKLDKGIRLARLLGHLGRNAGKEVVALLTGMDEPLGRAVGNSVEVVEAVECLKGEGPADLREVTLALTAEMLLLGGIEEEVAAARTRLERLLDEGAAFERMKAMVAAQGGDPRTLDDTSLLPRTRSPEVIRADREGFVAAVDALEIGHAVGELGAGRIRTDEGVDPRAGVRILRQRGDAVSSGDVLAEVHAPSSPGGDISVRVRQAFSFSDEPVPPRPVVRARVDRAGITVFN